MPSDYRLSPAVTARVVGLVVVSIALLMLLTTLLVAFLDLHSLVLTVPLVLGLAVLVGAAVVHQRRGWVVRLSDEGYRVQWVRGAGVAAARWKDVEDAVTTEVAGSPVLVLRLRDGRTTTIPVEMVAADRDSFARDVVEHLQRGQGLRPL
ncbi:hypothetical protein EXE58_06885 [Nocardioides seonyuensis]|uniref:Uncharacterized protein n=1 Tax=Nocardioides seonyuensis TaxID=2518371 RepID=A0A4P7IDG0_9ACTN|nr:hypothetical protein [Nocardioides seonyuensis]QBX55204.1 hypothetical protein EXE58_06885 [Nocardioides seonyuensis]